MSRKGEQGMALAVVLMVMAILTAMVVEFAYGVALKTDMLNNWYSLQRLSLAANSGVSVASKVIVEINKKNTDENKDNDMDVSLILPPYQFFEEPMSVSLSIQDEYARFNVNRLVNKNGLLNDHRYEGRYEAFLRMLDFLELDAEVADRIVDWIDQDEISMLADSEMQTRNLPLSSIEEVSQIPGIDAATYAKLKPYITVHGSGAININLAEEPVLMAISPEMGKDMAQLIIKGRGSNRFETEADVNSAAPGYKDLKDKLTVVFFGNRFRVLSIAQDEEGLVRTVECVLEPNGKVVNWRED
ncbi:MAG: type II secretion system minor pseudopilin GspK [Thermodesulfovibrionales bacterium]|nr:type II secretion system minor pseudopilin GspK [Thermodesulfovibrionales bacterium]